MEWWRSGTQVRPMHGVDELRTGSSVAAVGSDDWIRRMPRGDIDGCITFSKLRCILSLVSLLLLASDIPRTGLGVRTLSQYYPNQLAPSAAVYFGPFAYPVANIVCNASDNARLLCDGNKGVKPLANVAAWSYGFDTTSIGLRGAAQLFNISSYPSFLRYQGSDPRREDPLVLLDLPLVFTMLDGFVTGIKSWERRDPFDGYVFERFATEHVWIDRLHQYLMRSFIANVRWRVHSINTYTKESRDANETLDVCSQLSSRAYSSPGWCGDYFKWRNRNFANQPMPGTSIHEHINERIRLLQESYPDLWLDAVIVSTRQPMTTSSVTYSTFFHNDAWEIVMITRGRLCDVDPFGNNCTTKLIDDFRYERIAITTNVAEWYAVAACARGAAQIYVWVHLVLLLYMCHSVTPTAHEHHRGTLRGLAAAVSTMLKIPFQVVVYGSYIPITLYVLALLIDGKFTDSYLDSYWSTVGGAKFQFHVVDFVRTASVQMRNVWILALFAKLWTYFQTRSSSWQPSHGILGVQGLAISFTSFMSIFGPYKSKSFRNTNITMATFLAQSGPGHSTRLTHVHEEPTELFNSDGFELGDSLWMTMLTLVVVIALHICLVALSKALMWPRLRYIFVRISMIVPHTAGAIWSTTSLAVCFRAHLRRPNELRGSSFLWRRAQISPGQIEHGGSDEGTRRLFQQREQTSKPSLRTATTTVRGDEWYAHFSERNVTSNSVIQLMNIAMMSDPWIFLRLRTIGVELYVYAVQPDVQSRSLSFSSFPTVLLPVNPATVPAKVGLNRNQYELIKTVNSRDLPLWVLLHCG